MNCHASEETLEQYATGCLSEEQLAPLEEHLLVCEDCRNACAETESYVGAMRSAAEQIRHPQRPGGGWLRRILNVEPRPLWALGLAGGIFALLAGIQWQIGQQNRAVPVLVALAAARGPEGAAGAQAAAGTPLMLNVDLAELPGHPSYRLEVVTAGGERMGEWSATPAAGKLSVRLDGRLATGTYFVRLYSPQRELLREYALRIVRNAHS